MNPFLKGKKEFLNLSELLLKLDNSFRETWHIFIARDHCKSEFTFRDSFRGGVASSLITEKNKLKFRILLENRYVYNQ